MYSSHTSLPPRGCDTPLTFLASSCVIDGFARITSAMQCPQRPCSTLPFLNATLILGHGLFDLEGVAWPLGTFLPVGNACHGLSRLSRRSNGPHHHHFCSHTGTNLSFSHMKDNLEVHSLSLDLPNPGSTHG